MNSLTERLLALTPVMKDPTVTLDRLSVAGACGMARDQIRHWLEQQNPDADGSTKFKASEWIESPAFTASSMDWLIYGGERLLTQKLRRQLAQMYVNLYFLRLEDAGLQLSPAFKAKVLRRVRDGERGTELDVPFQTRSFTGRTYHGAVTIANICDLWAEPMYRINCSDADNEIILTVLKERLK